MTKKVFVWLLVILFVANVSVAQAQQAAKIPRIGYLAGALLSAISDRIEAFTQGLRELGLWKERTLSLSDDQQRETLIASARSSPSWCVSR